MKTTNVITLIIFLLTGCGLSNSEIGMCYPQGNHLDLFTEELDKRGITYTNDAQNPECVNMMNISDEDVQEIQDYVFGISPPAKYSRAFKISGFLESTNDLSDLENIEYKNDNLRAINILEENDIKVKTMVYFGTEHIVWNKKDDVRVRELLNLEPPK